MVGAVIVSAPPRTRLRIEETEENVMKHLKSISSPKMATGPADSIFKTCQQKDKSCSGIQKGS